MRDTLADKDYFDKRIIEEEGFLEEDYADVEDYIANRGRKARGISSAIVSVQLDCAEMAYSRGDEVSEVAARVDKAFKDYHYLIRVYQEHEDYFRKEYYAFRKNLRYMSYAVLYQPSQEAIDKLLYVIEFSDAILRTSDPVLLAMISYLKGTEINLAPLADAVEFREKYEDLWLAISNTGGGKIPPLKRYLETWYDRNHKYLDGVPSVELHENMTQYVGYWCWEAAAVAVMMDIDDTSFRDHEHYPKDLADWARYKKANG